MRLEGKVAIVTGGGRGIGKIYSQGLAAEGASVVVADIDPESTMRTAEEINRNGGKALGVPTDVADEASVQNLIEQTVSQFGGINVLLNNAGLMTGIPQHPSWEEITADEWDRVMAVNIRSCFLCSRAALPYLKEAGGGSIINVSSTTVINGGQWSVHYVTSKAGVMGFTRALARNVGQHNIRVNAIAPGATLSETVLETSGAQALDRVIPLRSIKRPQYPDDLVGTIIFLASDDSAFITGQMIAVDGGKDLH